MDVPPDRRFLGFDAYRHAIDCLKPGDVALLTTFSSFRAQHLEYAVERGVNVFMEKTFADGTKAMVTGRYIPNCHTEFATYIHGTKAAAKFSGDTHGPDCFIYKDQHTDRSNVAWRPPRETVNPWQAEWDVLLDAIRNDKPHNEPRRAAYSNLGAMMGRSAVHRGRVITWDEISKSNFRFHPDADRLTAASPAPVQCDAQGRYPAPIPGKWVEV